MAQFVQVELMCRPSLGLLDITVVTRKIEHNGRYKKK